MTKFQIAARDELGKRSVWSLEATDFTDARTAVQEAIFQQTNKPAAAVLVGIPGGKA